MRLLITGIIGFTCFCMLFCSPSPEHSTNDAFRKVDGSLHTSNKKLNDSLIQLYRSIKENSADAFLADSVVNYFTEAVSFIDSTQNVLKTIADLEDNNGDDIAVQQIFVRSNTGGILKSKLTMLYNKCYSALTTTSDRESFQKNFIEINSASQISNWQEVYFGGTPAVAAITILAKFKNDCIKMTGMALSDIQLQQRTTK